ncbi:MAG: hypothetical protein ACPHOK_10210, partial [Akkermansiaceae bacterium]
MAKRSLKGKGKRAKGGRLKLRRRDRKPKVSKLSQHVYQLAGGQFPVHALRGPFSALDTKQLSTFTQGLSRRQGMTAQLHKQSPVGTTRQLLCSRAAIPCRRQFLRKS